MMRVALRRGAWLAALLVAGPAIAAPVRIGALPGGAQVALVAADGGYGVTITGRARTVIAARARPVRVELFRSESDIATADLAYAQVARDGDSVVARTSLTEGGATLRIEDRYRIAAGTLRIARAVRVDGAAPARGFTSGWMLTAPGARFADRGFFAPGMLYGGPGRNNAAGAAGSDAFAAGRVAMREDAMPAPLVGLRLTGGATLALLADAPQGDTIEEDTRANAASVLIDRRFRFGAFGAAAESEGITFGYWLPGSVAAPALAGGPARRRYAPLQAGVTKDYTLALRVAGNEPLPAFMRAAWRWAYATLAPRPAALDLGVVRRVVTDQLASRALTVAGRTGLPWIHQATNGERWHRPDDLRAALGFVGKNLEAADLLLIEADRDPTARGAALRRTALAIIETFGTGLTMAPPSGEAIDLATGRPTVSFPPSTWRGNRDAGARIFLRGLSEDLRKLTDAYLREQAQGREHPGWLRWATDYADWLLPQQRADGSFPRAWDQTSHAVVEASSTASYAPVPLLAALARAHGASGARFRIAALRAADYVWRTQGSEAVFAGAVLDFPDVIDKEAGMLSIEAFLAAYDLTGDRTWVTRAAVAADFTETWMYVWDVPMADDAIDGELHWKRGVPTTGVNVVVIGGRGLVDQYLDWSTPAYARLWRLTGDAHYRDVARILLRNTKAMLALPGRQYDLVAPGWQQENFDLSLRRGYGGHRAWLPWVSVHHLWSIVGVEQLAPGMLKELEGG
ncbi:hypothetical protein F4693_002655 [Sphingomonas endophytica]|uniref:Glycosyl hydrolase n=1 Tax=Sphingomonas endophytica TaxID=869719 RepID=A0A7X0JDP9_9SPHN|nr:hypothetical protein [Sphingomonas endophytica]MBB6505660.1 hypothetical protein [Sphingomonas endophytica]